MKPGDVVRIDWPGMPWHDRKGRLTAIFPADDLGGKVAELFAGETFCEVEISYGADRLSARLALLSERVRPA